MNLIVPETFGTADGDDIRLGLQKFNLQHLDTSILKPLMVYFTDDTGKKTGGVIGYAAGNWLQIEFFWVDEPHRNKGLGGKLLASLENEALKRNCTHALVDTFSFQAKPFYEKHGYSIQMTLDNYPLEHKRYYLTKELGKE